MARPKATSTVSESTVARLLDRIAKRNGDVVKRQEQLNDAEAKLKAAVLEARAANVSWADIGKSLGRSRQSAEAKFDDDRRANNKTAVEKYNERWQELRKEVGGKKVDGKKLGDK
ncbi:MAG: hypothetical protein Q8K63_09140 [Acidimicrobiales bacterium]|nr:hypothetical protein [Acidimicrobiales bacterium]